MTIEETLLRIVDELEKTNDPVDEIILIMVGEALLEVYIRNIL